MKMRRFLLAGFSAAMLTNMLAGCSTPVILAGMGMAGGAILVKSSSSVPVVLSDLTEINRPEIMKLATEQWEAYEKTEALVVATEDALYQVAPNEALNWEYASEAARRAVEETSRLYLLEAEAGYAKVHEMRAKEKWQRVEQELKHSDWGAVARILFRMAALSEISSARNESKKAESARFSLESVAAADNAIRSTSEALNAASNVLQQAAPREWAVRLTAIAARDIAWAALNQAADLIAKGHTKGQNINPVPPESVMVFQVGADIPKHVKIGVLTSHSGGKKQLLNAMRKRAGELGANALIWDDKWRGSWYATVIRILEETEDRE